MHGARKRMIDRREAAREGRRWHAFYRGGRARKAGRGTNPHPPGSELARCWDAGWQYADAERADTRRAEPPVCQFGPGGDFARPWPREDDPWD